MLPKSQILTHCVKETIRFDLDVPRALRVFAFEGNEARVTAVQTLNLVSRFVHKDRQRDTVSWPIGFTLVKMLRVRTFDAQQACNASRIQAGRARVAQRMVVREGLLEELIHVICSSPIIWSHVG